LPRSKRGSLGCFRFQSGSAAYPFNRTQKKNTEGGRGREQKVEREREKILPGGRDETGMKQERYSLLVQQQQM